ncbi:MAG: LysM peptidoglycan-binding domain-containing protein [bacterium]|nr:LysM peptidoglycan-binding domain-containing protein [bacterium]
MRPRRIVATIVVVVMMMSLFGLVGAVMAQGETTAEPPAETTEQPATSAPQPSATAVVTATTTSAAGATATVTAVPGNTYRVVYGDTLFRIARRFNTTTRALAELNGIVNPNLIFAGQMLTLPAVGGQPTVSPATLTPTAVTPTAQPGGQTYVVQYGDTLARIAARNRLTVTELQRANPSITNPNIIFAGQRLNIPAPGTTAPVPTTAPATGGTPNTTATVENAGFAYGLETFFFGQDTPTLVREAETLGVQWVKVRVDWRGLEPEEGQIIFTELDAIVDGLDASGFNILFTVTNAPNWARSTLDENGPPDDLANFGTFVGALAERYQGRVDAYEIWDEPNLRRNWRCDVNGSPTICNVDYVAMLTQAYNTIKSVDADALVITAGLAPTGFNDGINAINDRLYLRTIYANGAAAVSDAVGTHPGGWANPPDARCCTQSTGVETHYEDTSFYFLDNLQAYRQIMVEAGDGGTPIWVTKFGWGSSEGAQEPNQNNIFYSYTSLDEQAIYVPRAFELGSELGFVGPMFLDNLNGCQGLSSRVEACYNALISAEGEARPVYEAVAAIEKAARPAGGRPLPPTAGEVTPEATAGS